VARGNAESTATLIEPRVAGENKVEQEDGTGVEGAFVNAVMPSQYCLESRNRNPDTAAKRVTAAVAVDVGVELGRVGTWMSS